MDFCKISAQVAMDYRKPQAKKKERPPESQKTIYKRPRAEIRPAEVSSQKERGWVWVHEQSGNSGKEKQNPEGKK